MRAKVELVIRDEDGNILSQLDPYLMDLGSQSLHDIEGAVENWRQKISICKLSIDNPVDCGRAPRWGGTSSRRSQVT